jgi:hypothetical protein
MTRPLRFVAASFLLAACAVPTTDAEDLGTAREEVQFQSMQKQFAIVQDGSTAAKATGALEVPIRENGVQATTSNGLPLRGTCGVTFVSPHYAVTASHCVDSTNVPDPTNDTITVRQYDVTQANLLSLAVTSLADGDYPNIHPHGQRASQVPGYQATAYSCKVVSRCSFGAFNCTTGGDVAMLYCGGRASNAPWLPIASSDPQTGPVEMYWFHELLSIPLDDPGFGALLKSQFDHYTMYPNAGTVAGQRQNWHYVTSPTNDLLPLKSIPWQGGIPRTRLGASSGGVSTDLFGCHGTSGSGVLQRNASGNLELLGPVRSGSFSWVTTRLCNHPDQFQPGQLGITYEFNSFVQSLQSKYSRALLIDRSAIRYFPPGGVFEVAQ